MSRRVLLGLAVFVLWPSAAVALDPATTVTVRSTFGFQLTPSYATTIVSGVQIIDVGPGPITLGRFSASGRVVDGDAVLVAFLHRGSAPVAHVLLALLAVSESNPVDEGATNTVGFVLPPEFPAFGPEFPAGGAPDGAEGELFIALALLERRSQDLTEALGVTIPFRVRIGEPGGFIQYPEGSLFVERAMTRGGAAQFRRFQMRPAPR